MKIIIFFALIWSVIFIAGVSPAQSEESYTFLMGDRGPQVCVGTWIPPRDVGLAGTCQGQIFGVPQLTAVSTKQTVDRLDQVVGFLSSIDEKLTDNNSRLDRLIEATVNTQTSIDRQVRQVNEFLRETITERFNELPSEMLENEEFRDELTKLKEDILDEVSKRYPPQPTKPASGK